MDMGRIMKVLHQRPVAYYPIYADLLGSVAAGVYFSQIMYWYAAADFSTFYKTDQEIIRETRLSAWELRKAKKTLSQCPFVTISRRGQPARTYYEIHPEKLMATLQFSQTSLEALSELDQRLSPNKFREGLSSSYTETTTETTTESKNQSVKTYPFPPGFQQFWEAWPHTDRRTSKRPCADIWNRKKLEGRTAEIVAKVTAWAQTAKWQEGFEPAPRTWLNGDCFDEDAPVVDTRRQASHPSGVNI